jgi:hypothetical protein
MDVFRARDTNWSPIYPSETQQQSAARLWNKMKDLGLIGFDC